MFAIFTPGPDGKPFSGPAGMVTASACLTVYSICNLVLSILSSIAWRQTHHAAYPLWWRCPDPASCHPSRSILQGIITMAATIASLTTGLMAARLMLWRNSGAVDCSWVFRGLLFTLLLLVPLLFIGWSAPEFDNGQNEHTRSSDAVSWLTVPASLGLETGGGIAGAFIIENVVFGSQVVKASVVMFHVNVFLGTILAGIVYAVAPWTSGKTIAAG